MEEKKVKKISLTTYCLFLAILAIGIMGYFLYKLNSDKENTNTKVAELNGQIEELKNTIKDMNSKTQNTTSSEINTTNNVEQSSTNTSKAGETTTNVNSNEIGKDIKEKIADSKGNEIYKKAIFSKTFLALLIENRNIGDNQFSDEQILKLLVEIDKEKEKSNTFTDSSNSTGFFVTAKIDDVQKLSQKYFGKKLNTDNLKGKDGDKIVVEVSAGFGIITDKFVSAYKMDNGDYFLTFEQIDETSSGSITYGLFVQYEEPTDSIIYKGFTSDIVSYVSKFNSQK